MIPIVIVMEFIGTEALIVESWCFVVATYACTVGVADGFASVVFATLSTAWTNSQASATKMTANFIFIIILIIYK